MFTFCKYTFFYLFLSLIIALLINTTSVSGQETDTREPGIKENGTQEPGDQDFDPEKDEKVEPPDFIKDSFEELEFYALEELLDSEVEVASLFIENELVVGSTVSNITSSQWKMLGARRVHEAIGNEMSVVSYPSLYGGHFIGIRGFTALTGISLMVDDIPINDVYTGTASYHTPNWDLGTLDRIEMIKGPGSAIYGSDAFHGVISMKTFESDRDHYSLGGAGAYPLYGDANIKLSQGFMDDLLRIDFSAGASYQGDQNLEYEYNDPYGWTVIPLVVQGDRGTSSRAFKHNSQTGALKINIRPADKLILKAGAYLARGKYDEYPGIVSAANPYTDEKTTMTTQDYDVSWNDTQLFITNSSIGYKLKNKISIELSGYYWQVIKDSSGSVSPSKYELLNITYEEFNRASGKIIIKQPDNALNLQWLVAYSYTSMGIDASTIDFSLRGQAVPTLEKQDNLANGYSRNIHSAFAQFKWEAVKDRINILIGGRNDYYSDFGNQVTPRGGLILLPNKKSAIKTLYGRAFRAPNASEQRGFEGIAKGDPDIKPEIIDIYEISYMYKEKKWKGSVNTFYSEWKNGIVLVDAPELETYLIKQVNKGKNRAYGGELNLFYAADPYALDLGFSFVKSYAMDVDNPYEPGKKWDQLYRTFPEYSVNAGIHYTLKPIDLNFYLNNIAYLNMKEAPEDLRPNPDSLPQYYRTDLNVSKTISGKLELYLNIRNLLNRKNYKPAVHGAMGGYVEPGISVMARAEYKL